jgi:16S rRNA (cytidine1402-2'-O)-methyltransferase
MKTLTSDLYIVATPIGNYDDITLRAINVLGEADFVVCEQEKEYKKLFGVLKLPEKKYILCNEHDEQEAIELVIPLLKKGEKGALITDCGTPIFEDPGFKLVEAVRKAGFKVTSLPGPSSLMTALSLSPFKVKDFYYAGLLPQKKEERKAKLSNVLKRKEVIIIFEAPYRLMNLISVLKEVINKDRMVFIAFNLTMDDEQLFSGRIDAVERQILQKELKKGEFVILIQDMH